MIIDSHAHVISDDRRRYPLLSDEHGPDTRWYLDEGVTAERLAELLGPADVDRALLVQPAIAYGDDNRYVLDSVSRHRDFFGVVGCTGHPILPGDVERLLDESGVVSLRLFDVGSGVLADPRTTEVAETLAARSAPLVLHTDVDRLSDLVQLMKSVPKLEVVLDHGAVAHVPDPRAPVPWASGGPLRELAVHPQIHIKVTPVLFSYAPDADLPRAATDLVAAFGPDRLLWGSDFSHSRGPYAALVKQVLHFVRNLPDAHQCAVLGGTALRLWPDLAT